jgi:biopolymer transport protein ExbD
MKKRNHSPHGTLAELNITPLLDLVFVLLVIFIITTPQMMNNLEMALPSGKPPVHKPGQPEPKLNRLLVDENGQIQLNGEALTIAALKGKLIQLKGSDPDPSIVVKGADEVDYQNMVNVLDLLRQLDITKVGLATEAAGAPSKS